MELQRLGARGLRPAGGDTLIYPILVLDLHQVCNQRCEYCVSGSGPEHAWGRCSEIKKIEPFLSRLPQWNVLLTGGEPLITPNLEEILTTITKHGQVSLQTNLKTGIERFTQVVPPEKTGWILATLHSCALERADKFIDTVLELRWLGYPVVVKLILDEKMVPVFAAFCDRFISLGIPYILAPLVSFPDANAAEYSRDVEETAGCFMTLPASTLYFQNGLASKGMPCHAGSKLFYARLDGGQVEGCCHGYPKKLGNIWKNRFRPETGTIKCGLDRCMCDFHWYAGIVPGYDCSGEWEKLIK